MSRRIGVSTIRSLLPRIDYALSFDGIDDYIEVMDASSLNFGSGDFSVFMWVKTTAYPSIGKYGSIADIGWVLNGTATIGHDGELVVAFTDSARNFIEFYSDMAINDGEFHFVGFVRSSNLCYIYIDGVSVKTQDISSIGNISSTSSLLIGAIDSDAIGDFYDGIIDEVRIYNRALTLAEIQHNMVAKTPILDGLVLWLPMNEGVGNTVHDKSGRGNNGTIYGATWVRRLP